MSVKKGEAPKVTSKLLPIKKVIKMCIKFCEALAGFSYYPYQKQFIKRIIESLLMTEGAEIDGEFSRQSGKSTSIGVLAGGLSIALPFMATLPIFKDDPRIQQFAKGLWIGIYAPIMEQSEGTFNKVKHSVTNETAIQILELPELALSIDTNNGNTFRLSNGSIVGCFSASENAKIEGKTWHLVIVEEAQDVLDTKIKKSISPMLASTNGTKVFVGTAGTMKGYFFDLIERNKKEKLLTGIKNHFEYDYLVAGTYNKKYAIYAENEKKRLGEDSDEFRMSYKNEWILERGMFITPDILDRLSFNYDNITTFDVVTEYIDKELGIVLSAGIDFGKSNDSTVVTIVEANLDANESEKAIGAYRKRIVAWLEIQGDDYDSQFYEIMEFLECFDLDILTADSTGVGDPIVDRFINALSIPILPYNFSNSSKSVLCKFLDQEMRGGRVRIPAGRQTMETREYKNFMTQMSNWEKYYVGQFMICNHPDEKEMHDDYGYSLALSVLGTREFAVQKEQTMGEVEQSENIFLGGR